MFAPQPLSYATTTAQTLSNLILVSPRATIGYQPKNPKFKRGSEPPPLLFNFEAENSLELTCDITDHFVEDNSTRQDQIAIRPEIVTVHGFIGELNDVVPEILTYLKLAAEKLTTIGAYVPQLSATALIAYNTAFQVYQAANTLADSAVSLWNITDRKGLNVIDSNGITNFNAETGELTGAQNKQQTALQQFYGYARARTFFRIQTPWAVLDDMVIQSLRVVQNAETNLVSDFFITFKKFRIASTQTVASVDQTYQGRAKAQATDVTNVGPNQVVPSIPLSTGISGVTN